MDESEPKSGGFIASVRRITDSVLAILNARMELAALEFQEERIRLIDLVLRVAAVVVLGLVSLLAATALLVVAFWDYSRLLTLGVLAAVYALAALVIWWDLRKRINTSPSPLAGTLA